MDKTRLALIGVGMIGKRHLKAMRDVEEAELAALVDTVPGVSGLAREWSVPFFETTDSMLKEIAPDGVIVCTPTEVHLEPVLQSLDAGAHVLVEKPITASLEEARKIIEKASATRKQVLVGHHRRHYGILHKTKQLLNDGALGQLIAVHGMWTTRKADAYYEPEWRKLRSSGPVLINLIHEIDTLRYLCGEVKSLSAKVSGEVRNHPKEETAALVMELENGVLGTFLLSDVTPSPWTWEHGTGENPGFPKSGQNAYRFVGTKGSLEFPNLRLWKTDGEPDWHHPMIQHDEGLPLEDAYIAQCRHFCRVIQNLEPPRITAEDATRTLAATLAVFDSAEQGRQIEL